MDRSSAYKLRARPEAQQFRLAWDAALDLAVRLITDGAFSRAIHGVPVPHFHRPVLSACLGRQSKGASRSVSRRWRLQQARTRHHETLRREREKAGGGGVGG